jgi:hypothetical protein
MFRSILRGAVLAAPAAILLACLASNAPAVQRTVTIYQIQDTTLAGHVVEGSTDTVTTTGIITGVDSKPSGLGYYIQDAAGGAFSGVLVFTGGQAQFADSGLALGDVVQVTGRITEFGGETEIISRSGSAFTGVPVVQKLSSGALPSPSTLAQFGNIAQTASYNIAERWEGVFVQLPDTGRCARSPILLPAPPGVIANQFLIVDSDQVSPTDSVRVNGETLANPSYAPIPFGALAPHVQGIGVQRIPDGGYGIQLRDNSDIVAFAPPVLLNAYATSNTNIHLVFDKPLNVASAQTVGNYSRVGTLKSIQAATIVGDQEVDLTTTTQPQVGGEAEQVRASNVQASFGNVPMPNPMTEAFRAGITPINLVQTNAAGKADTSQFNGQQVTIRGKVMARDESTYYIQDNTTFNPSSGFIAFSPPITFEQGDDVTISSVVIEFGSASQATEFSGADYAVINSSGNVLYAPVVTTPANIGPLTGVKPYPGERFEGMFVAVNNVTVTAPDTLPNGQFQVQGSGGAGDTVRVDDTMFRHLYAAGTKINVRGTVNDAFGQFTINPRDQADYDSLGVVGVEPGPGELAFRLNSVSPTPVSFAKGGQATMSFVLPTRGTVSMRIYDLAGRLVAAPIAKREMDAGPQVIRFDGRSLSGSMLRSGIFFVQLQLGNSLASGKLVVTD